MSDKDLFEGTPTDEGTVAPVDKTGEGEGGGYLATILNDEGKQKYATVEEALKGSVNAQEHIKTIEAELKTLREDADKGVNMEQILDALKASKTEDNSETPATGITPEQLASSVEQLLDKRESVQSQKQNVTTVTSLFKEKYGEKASEVMYGKANDLGFSKSEINSMIAHNPKAALAVLDSSLKGTTVDVVTSGGDVNTAAFQIKGEEKPRSVMGATNSKELTDSWKISQAATLKRLEAQAS